MNNSWLQLVKKAFFPTPLPTNGQVMTFGATGWGPAAAGGGGLLASATLTLTDNDIKHILGTPKTLVTPAAGTAILPVAGWAICQFAGGVYVDPDANQNGSVVLMEQGSGGMWWRDLYVANALMPNPQPGAVNFFEYVKGGPGNGQEFGQFLTTDGSNVLIGGGPLIVRKHPSDTQEFTGGGAGNTLKIILYYIAVPTS